MNHSSVYHPPQHNSSISNGGNYGSFPSSPNTASNNYHQQQYSASSPSIVGSSSTTNANNNNTMNGMMNNTILHQPPSSYNSVHNHHHNIPPPSQSTPVSSQYYSDNYSTSEYSRPNTSEYHSMNGTMTPQTPSYQNASPQYGNNPNNFIYNIPPSQQSQHNYHNGMQGVNNSYQFGNNNQNNSNGMNRMSNNQNNSSPPMHVNQQPSEPIPSENSPDLKLGDLEYHPIACICCRKMHKQCDKKLPSCQRCLSKGITCEYKTPRRMRYPNQSKQKQPQSTTTEEYQQPVEPKKKKKKTDSKDNLTPKSNSPLDLENITPPNTTLTSKLPQNLSKKNIIDIYYSMICDHFIFIDKSVLEKYVLSKSNDDADDSELPLKKEMQAFFFSVTALVEQRLGIDCSEKSAKKARDCLSKLFDEMNNFVIACSYANLGSYEIGSGRVKLSRFYFHNSKFYFESMDDAEKSKLSEYEKALQKYLTSVEIVNADNDLGITTMIQDIPKVFHFTTGHHLPQEIIKATQQEVSPSNCLDYLKIVEMIASYLNKYFRGMATKTRGEKEMEMYDKGSNLCQGLLMNGLRVGVLTKAGYGKDLIEESSLRITYASESEFFPFLPVIVIPHVALAARIHLQIVKKIENGTRQNHQKGLTFHNTAGPIDYFDILAKDYRSLIILSKRFKRVSVCYGSLLDEIKEILGRRAESQQNNDASSTNNSNTVSTPITDEALLHPLSLDSSSLPPLSFLLGSMNDNTPTQPQQSSSQKSSLDGYTSNTSTLQQSIFNSIIQSPIKSPSQQQELYFADPFFTHEDLQQIFSPHTYGDFEDGEFSFNVK